MLWLTEQGLEGLNLVLDTSKLLQFYFDYFNPGKMQLCWDVRVKLKGELEGINHLKRIVNHGDKSQLYTTALSTEYAHQSAALEGK